MGGGGAGPPCWQLCACCLLFVRVSACCTAMVLACEACLHVPDTAPSPNPHAQLEQLASGTVASPTAGELVALLVSKAGERLAKARLLAQQPAPAATTPAAAAPDAGSTAAVAEHQAVARNVLGIALDVRCAQLASCCVRCPPCVCVVLTPPLPLQTRPHRGVLHTRC